MITIKNLSIRTETLKILDSTDYTFNDGLNLIVAQNGLGKTTLLRALLNLIPSTSDEILFDGKNLTKNKNAIFFYENTDWFDKNLTAMDYLEFTKKKWQSSIDIMHVIQEFKMDDYYNKPIKKYSLGMKQRVLIAMYEISDATYFLMDEINNGLDEESRNILYSFLNRVKKNKTILVTTHYKSEMEAIADEIVTIENFKLKEYK
ncbi:ATP-binding cassette domain-containing protein [Dellaglioa sp. BT-FLS60]